MTNFVSGNRISWQSIDELTQYGELPKIFSVLASENNIQLFIQAKSGLKFNFHLSEKLGFSKRQYHRGVASLKRVGLIEKTKNTRRYFHTSFGKAIYQNISSMKEYTKQAQELKIVDVLKQSGQFAETDVLRLMKKILPATQYVANSVDDIVVAPHPKVLDNAAISIVWSYEKMTELLLEQTQQPKHEILIATRVYPDVVINHLLDRVKSGVDLKVLLDTNLINHYVNLHKIRLNATDKNAERLNKIANPWYPHISGDSIGKGKIERRMTNVPFGMIIPDNDNVGIELIDAYNPSAFTCGMNIQSRGICTEMRKYYQRLWEQASPVTSIMDNIFSK